MLVERQTISSSLFDDGNLPEIISDDDPKEPLIVCRNPLLAAEQARKLCALLAVAEKT